MQYSSRLTIAVHILLCIVQFEKEAKVTSTFLAGSIGVNPVIVRNVLGRLQDAGLVRTRAGVGGSTLARSPREISLLDVFRAVEDAGESLFHFHENPNPDCQVGRAVHAVLDQRLASVQSAMEHSMQLITLQSMIDDMQRQQTSNP